MGLHGHPQRIPGPGWEWESLPLLFITVHVALQTNPVVPSHLRSPQSQTNPLILLQKCFLCAGAFEGSILWERKKHAGKIPCNEGRMVSVLTSGY